MSSKWAAALAPELAEIDPWRRLGSSPQRLMAGLLRADDPFTRCRCLLVDGAPAGAMAVRNDWLLGPYLLHLSVLPAFQRQGHGRWLMAAFEADGRAVRARNLWVCASAFNRSALAFYEDSGFARIGLLDDLIVDGLDEVLLRKRLIY
jgi:ribosomal protein S18 acetylase RimI-like enzyme